MKIRHLKKLLKHYKPIVEIRVPVELINSYRFDDFKNKVGRLLGKTYTILVFPVGSASLSVLTEMNSKDAIEIMKGFQKNPFVVNSKDNVPVVEFLPNVIIHSIFGNGVPTFKKKALRIQELIYSFQNQDDAIN